MAPLTENAQFHRALPLLAASIAACGGIHAIGAIRLDARDPEAQSVKVAAIAMTVGPGADGMPSAEAIASNDEGLFAKTERAAALGARLVAWNECATLVDPARENSFVERGRIAACGAWPSFFRNTEKGFHMSITASLILRLFVGPSHL